METSFNYCNKEQGFFSSDERKFINQVHRLHEEYPEQVRIIAEPEENDGCIYCELPSAWLKIRPKRVLSEEQKQKLISASESFRFASSEHGNNKRENVSKIASGDEDE